MKRLLRLIETAAVFLMVAAAARAQSWNIATGYSGSYNPNGVWSFGAKSSAAVTGMTLLSVQWGNQGWYLAGSDGAPSMQAGPLLWPWANQWGIPCVRWTCPETGYYDITGNFTGDDSRGEDVYAAITTNGSFIFQSLMTSYLQVAPFTNMLLTLNKGDYVDFTIAWAGNNNSQYNWTGLTAMINTDTNPQAASATADLVNGYVVGVTLTSSGLGYTNTPLVRFIGGGGTGAQAVAVVSNGVVTSVTINDPGSDYTSAPIVVIAPPFIQNPGVTMAPLSSLTFSNLTMGGTYQLQQWEGYYWSNLTVSLTATDAPYTQIVGGVANSTEYQLAASPVPAQAFATAEVVNGFVVGITITSGGSGYVAPPAVTIVGSGSNAAAVAAIGGGIVTNITLTDPGIGYTAATTVEIAQPPTVAVAPTVLPLVQINATNLAPYDNYQLQFAPTLGAAWEDWNGGLLSPTSQSSSQVFVFTNRTGFFRMRHLSD
ncbi:MAG: hypothetical protein ACLQVY_22200 [Limisphaerales bacterium]